MNLVNPYRDWLGLDPGIVAPNHYELFSLDNFEGDLAKISQAADRAISRVRSCRPGSQAREWSSLLDTLDVAKQTLLDPTQKAIYDQHLQAADRMNAEPQQSPLPTPQHPLQASASAVAPHAAAPQAAVAPVTAPAVAPAAQQSLPVPGSPIAPQPMPAAALNPAQAPYYPPQQPPASASGPSVPVATAAAGVPQPANPTAAPMAIPASTPAVAAAATVPVGAMAPYAPASATAASPTVNPMAPVSVASPSAAGPTAAYGAPTGTPMGVAVPAAHASIPVASSSVSQPAPGIGGGKTSVANAQRRRRKSAAATVPIFAIGAALVALLGGLLYLGLTRGSNSGDQTQVASQQQQLPGTPEPSVPAPISTPQAAVSSQNDNVIADDDSPATPNTDSEAPASLSMDDGTSVPTMTNDSSEAETADDDPTMMLDEPTPDAPADTPDEPVPTSPAQDAPAPATPQDDMPSSETPANDKGDEALTQAQLVELGKLLTSARTAIGMQNHALVEEQLKKAEAMTSVPSHLAKIRRLKQLNGYVKDYWEVVLEAIAGFEGGEELPYRNSVIVIVERTRTHLTVRYNGQNITRALDDLPAGIAMAVADHWFDESEPSNLVFKGAWGLVMPNGSDEEREKAFGWWEEALANGVDIKDLMQVAEDEYDFSSEASK